MEIIDSYMKQHYNGYYFIIEFYDGLKINDDAMELNLKHLYEFDHLTMDKKSYDGYLNNICNRYNKTLSDIKSVKIGNRNKRHDRNFTYSLVKNNPYVEDVISYIKNVDIYGVNNYKTNQYIITSDCPAYQEMKDFLLSELRSDNTKFLNQYFTMNTKFKSQLQKYSELYRSNFNNEEDTRNLYRIQRQISEELSIYKIYRNLAVKRYYFESIDNKYANSKDKVSKAVINRMNDSEFRSYLDRIQAEIKSINKKVEANEQELAMYVNRFKTTEEKTIDYDQRNDEYIEPNEYDQMTGYTGERVK